MKKIYFLFGLAAIALVTFLYYPQQAVNFHDGFRKPSEAPGARKEWDAKRLVDPATGQLPQNIHTKELVFASTLPNDIGSSNLEWTAQGPYNVGGRTRALALDVTDENILIAGGASGGIWRTTNQGESWDKMTRPFQLHNVTCIEQDTRSGKEQIWYHGTGELTGSSASGGGAYFDGNGIYKSVDGGITWDSIPSTSDNNAAGSFNPWDFIWNVVLDPSNEAEDELYVATYGSIYRTIDGGDNWTEELGGGSAYYNNVEVTSEGVVYASLSSDGTDKGIWRSANGADWTNILPDSFPSVYGRTAMGINPSNENEIYFLTAETEGSGQHTNVFFGGETWTSLWKYTYVCDGGNDTCGIWEDLSINIPANRPTTFDNFNAQGGYDLVVKVKPDNSDVVFIGGTNLWRSTDGFSSDTNTTQIGGYFEGSDHGYGSWDIYETHHPDQHELLFLPSNPNIILSGTDGGIFKSENCLATPHVWERLNNGYQTTQLYSVSISKDSGNDIILGGFQDNGNFITFSDDNTAEWTMPFNGDGSYNAIADNEEDFYIQIQRGVLFKMQLNEQGEVLAYNRMDPLDADTSTYQFINYLAMDPNNDDVLYFPNMYNVWRNNAANDFPYNNSHERIMDGWEVFNDTTRREITCLDVSTEPADVLYVGTDGRYIYRVDNANTGDPEFTEIGNIQTSYSSNISAIEVDPEDANKVMVAISNYNTYSLFYTEDGGDSWEKIAGNLETSLSGGGNGPSLRTVEILHLEEHTLYLVGSSTGLYATYELDGLTTEWTQIGTESIGSVVVENIKVRASDGKLVVGTHGTGIYTTYITDITDVFPDILAVEDLTPTKFEVYPNPTKGSATIKWDSECNYKELLVIDALGKVVKEEVLSTNKLVLATHNWPKGVYYITLKNKTKQQTQKLIVQ
jgi:photosystem II stability/assembly factor-like uncharacterized protein